MSARAPPVRVTNLTCAISAAENMKALVACFTFLNKVGKELQLEATSEVLTLRALNDAKTAYAHVDLDARFFNSSNGLILGDDLEGFTCKVQLRPLCAVCKNLRNVELLTLRAERLADTYDLVLEMKTTETGIMRTHRFKYNDCEVLSAIFDDESMSSLKSSHKIFDQILSNMFQSPEIAISPTQTDFKVRSHHPSNEAQAEAKKHMSTDLSIETDDFDFYDYKPTEMDETIDGEGDGEGDSGTGAGGGGSNSSSSSSSAAAADALAKRAKRELVFCTRELKAILHLCDSMPNLENIQMSFCTPGQPIRFQTSNDLLTAQLVMTTQAVRSSAGAGSSSHNTAVSSSSGNHEAAASSSSSSQGANRANRDNSNTNGKSKQQTSAAAAAAAAAAASVGSGGAKAPRINDDDDDHDDDDDEDNNGRSTSRKQKSFKSAASADVSSASAVSASSKAASGAAASNSPRGGKAASEAQSGGSKAFRKRTVINDDDE